jgi:hypothetical protein
MVYNSILGKDLHSKDSKGVEGDHVDGEDSHDNGNNDGDLSHESCDFNDELAGDFFVLVDKFR